jgi:hypothetical protein
MRAQRCCYNSGERNHQIEASSWQKLEDHPHGGVVPAPMSTTHSSQSMLQSILQNKIREI